ncbi:MAG: hypothetical protein QHC78_07175 [Pigmentiphaga sp.]|uniref:hypothetical protein n=1 Tax=Pigmentiphaga sp. TaxID=1977564 RepID=UPI0029B06851|nr:hypothetical protein [Pigmentiphaga sp.]MDX3905454.1 hypothetical protein [Pigmentiphaga sp.]
MPDEPFVFFTPGAGVVIRTLREPEAASKLWLACRRQERSGTGAAFWRLAHGTGSH